jgi:hypothetical protein
MNLLKQLQSLRLKVASSSPAAAMLASRALLTAATQNAEIAKVSRALSQQALTDERLHLALDDSVEELGVQLALLYRFVQETVWSTGQVGSPLDPL